MRNFSRARENRSHGYLLGCLVAIGGSGALALSAWLTWASWNLADRGASRSLLELPVVPWLLAASIAVIVGSTLVSLAGDPRAAELGGHVAMGVALFAALFLLGAQMLTTVVPKLGLPGTAHRLAVGTAAGPGPWLTLAAGLAIAVTTIGSLRQRARAMLAELSAGGPAPVVAVAVFLLTVPLLMLLQQEIWIVAEVPGGELSLGGDTLGWATWPLRVAPLLLVGAAGCVCVGRYELGALVGAFAGWAANISAAIAIVFTDTLVRASVSGAGAATSVWLTFALGFVPAAAAAALLRAGGEPA